MRRPRCVVLAEDGGAALVEDALGERVAVIGRTNPYGEDLVWTRVVQQASPCVEFEAWVAVVRQAFPRRDDDDFDMRAPRNGSGGLPPDLHVFEA